MRGGPRTIAQLAAVRHFSDTPSRLPDGHAFPTTPATLVTRVPMTSTSAGAAALFIEGYQLQKLYYDAPSFTTNDFPITAVGTASNVANFTSLDASFARMRVLNVHVSIRYIGAPLNAAGQLTVKLYAGAEDGTAIYPTNFESMTADVEYYDVRHPVSICLPPFDLTYREFKDLGETTTEQVAFPSVAIFGTGLEASKTLFVVTIKQKVELMGEPQDFASRLGGSHPDQALDSPSLDLISSIGNKVAASGKSIMQSAADGIGSHVHEALTSVAQTGLESIVGGLSGALAASARSTVPQLANAPAVSGGSSFLSDIGMMLPDLGVLAI